MIILLKIIKKFFSPINIRRDGSHLVSIWAKVEDQNIWFPWYHRNDKKMHHWVYSKPDDIHDYVMDYLRSGIGLRAMGQRDPLVEYQKEGYDLFEDLIHNVKLSVVRLLLNFEKITKENNNLDKEEKNKINTYNKDKIGRNEPCYCGSGIKYKKCGMIDRCIKNS